MSQCTDRWMRCPPRGVSLALLLALSIAVPNLSPCRGFAGEEPPNRNAAAPKQAEAERAPFDLTYVPPDALGVIALRPNAIFRDPAMKPLARLVNQSPVLREMLLPYVPSTEWKLPVEEIEQIVFYTSAIADTKHASGFGAMTVMIRAAHDFDWLPCMQQIDPKTEKVRWGDQVYYRSHPKFGKGDLLAEMPVPPKVTFAYLIPDKRTLILLSPEAFRALRAGKSIQRPHFSWDNDWKHVERCIIAWAADNRAGRWASNKRFPDDPFEEWTALAQKATILVAGLDWKDGIDFRAYLAGKDHSVRDQMAKDIKVILKNWPLDMEQALQDVPKDERQNAAFELRMYNDLFKHVRVMRRENTVCVHTSAKLTASDLAKHVLGGVPIQWKMP